VLTPLARQAFAAFSALVTLLPALAAAPASRVISLNLCTDQLVLALADRSAIVSVTYLARDCTISAQCRAAASEPINYGTAEELVAAEPDLVLGGRYTTRPAIGIARRLGMKVLEFDPPSSLDMVRRQIRDVAEALGRPERSETMIAALDGRLAALPQAAPEGERPVATVYQANGMTVGANSLIDAALQAAGFDNLARRLGLENYMYLPLETLIAGRPDPPDPQYAASDLPLAGRERPEPSGDCRRHRPRSAHHRPAIAVDLRLARDRRRYRAAGASAGAPRDGTAINGKARDGLLLASLALLAATLFVASALIGRVPLAVSAAVTDLWHGRTSPAALILFQLRFPRALLGLLVGMTLGLSGAVMQGLLRNPLAEPGVLGVSAMAAFGAVVAFYTGLSLRFSLALPFGGIVGAFLAVAPLGSLAGTRGSIFVMLLAGAAINSLAGALTALALNLSPNPYAAYEILFWLMGSLVDRSLDHVALAAPLMAIGWVLLLSSGRALDALTLGEETARSLGFALERVRLRLILGTAFAVGAAVAVSGAIGFVGLVIPHLLRPLVGHEPSRLLVPSALGGGCLVLAADIAVRWLRTGPELRLGVLTALIGAPFFLLLVLRLRREAI